MTGTVVPARSPITLTKSLSAGTMILVLSFKASATVSSFLSSCALPIKYSSAATLTILMASPSASAFNRIATAIPSAFLISARLSPSALVSIAVARSRAAIFSFSALTTWSYFFIFSFNNLVHGVLNIFRRFDSLQLNPDNNNSPFGDSFG